ncbi:MAG: DUF4143 domain-containing protein [Acidimicrobiales bacterium]|jgi:hypothetical protein
MTRIIEPIPTYTTRVAERELDALLHDLPALSLEGPKGVGKTRTAERRAAATFRLDDPAVLEVITAQPNLLTTAARPTLIDEWQRHPASWDLIRRAVDDDHSPGRFILTGSATPSQAPAHSGASRIVPIRMRPLTLHERELESPTVSLAVLLGGTRPTLEGTTDVTLEDYTTEILTGGFPGMRYSSSRSQRAALNGYIDRVIDTDLPEIGVDVRNPHTLRRWLRAYAGATATITSFEKIREAAASGDEPAPAKTTAIPYREALERVWILDPVPAWAPTNNHLRQLVGAPKHHLADPALAARLVGLDVNALLRGEGPDSRPRDGTFLGALFESLAALDVRVFAQSHEASTFHVRDHRGRHEIDFVVVRDDQRVVAFEVKLSATVGDADVRHLLWLREQLGEEMLDGVVLTTGTTAYRRRDGIGVVPLALLGP